MLVPDELPEFTRPALEALRLPLGVRDNHAEDGHVADSRHDDPAPRRPREAVRQGAIGEASHSIGLLSPWGFSLDEIEPAVHLWHGGQDSWVELRNFERVAASLRHGTLTVWPDAGHFGIAKYWSSVLEAALG